MNSKIIERNKKFCTEEGLKIMANKMDNLINLFNNYDFAFEAPMMGFGKLSIKSKEECLHRIKELSHLIGREFKIVTEVIKDKNSEKTIKKIEVQDGS